MMLTYILDDAGNVVPEPDIALWSIWFEKNTDKRIIARTELSDCMVSTVFLGMDHGFGGNVRLFETMIFSGPHDSFQERYATKEEALLGHERTVILAGKEPGKCPKQPKLSP